MPLKILNHDDFDLNKLGRKYLTDKVDINHTYKGITYLDIYQRYMGTSRLQVKTFVEIGVCGGHSLRMWKEYFPNATIYGIDIDPSCRQHAEERIEIIIGDQNDDNFLKSLAEKFKDSIDILLDDGSHITKHQIKTYSYLYPCIKSGGLFIIEDLANSYEEWVNDINLRDIWPGMIYNKSDDELKNYREDFNTFINSVVKKLDLNKLNKEDTHLVSIHHYPMIVIFENC
jgi:predicted O-methyltransferase YrrM